MTFYIKKIGGEWAVMDATSDTTVDTFRTREQARIFIRSMVGLEHAGNLRPIVGAVWAECHRIARAIATVDDRSKELEDGSWAAKKSQHRLGGRFRWQR